MRPNFFKKTTYGKLDVSVGDGVGDGRTGKAADLGREAGAGEAEKVNVPAGIMIKCMSCGQVLYARNLYCNDRVCTNCGSHFRISSNERLARLLDEGSLEECFGPLASKNPIDFPGYEDKVIATQLKTGLTDGVLTGKGRINGSAAYFCVMDAEFMMASMGQVVGEKITRVFERAAADRLPVVVFAASGGARMQEGIFSLMQMAKISGAVAKHHEAGLLYITVLTHPTTGGVTASFAMEGDIILAEPGALVGFAGPRVIEQTIRQKLPDGFQTAEFLLEHGFVDRIVERQLQREFLGQLLAFHCRDGAGQEPVTGDTGMLPEDGGKPGCETEMEPAGRRGEREQGEEKEYSAWDKVRLARMQGRPTGLDYIERIFEDFSEFHGDRYFGDDRAVVGGIASLEGRPLTVIAIQKGRNMKENVERNFGMPNPEGYRKALRLMKQAEKFGRPVVCFIDTPGAYPGIGAEERGQGEAIAKNLMEMMRLKTVVVSFITGEGGSGGALALGVSDRMYMLEHSVYSILSPEGFASILWKDSSRAAEAAGIMKLTAKDLLDFGVSDALLPEPDGGAQRDVTGMAERIAVCLKESLYELAGLDTAELIEKRYQRFRKF